MGAIALLRLSAAALLACPVLSAHAHEVGGRARFPAFEPWAIAALALSAFLYAFGLYRLWRKAGPGRGISRGQALRFLLGWSTLVAALLSPIDRLGAQLFSMHMVQHELLMALAAPLLVSGRPLEAWTWALAMPARKLLAAFARHGVVRSVWSAMTEPLVAWTLHALALWVWHVPALFERALESEGVHVLQHASFLGSALLFWWSVLGRAPRRDAVAVASLFTTMLHTGALGALLTFAPRVWYPHYGAATGIFGLSALEDQQLGGLIMWVPAGAAYVIAALAIAASWLSPPGLRGSRGTP